MREFSLPPEALYAMGRLEAAGFSCYAVGGFVRDALLGIPCHDVDLTTAAAPADMRRVFEGDELVPTGEKHGTMTLVKNGVPIEITAYRAEMPYLDGRHPSGVTFSGDIRADLSRRDFTINAMAWSPARGLEDPFHGEEDLKNKILRCVGRARDRFEEDALRMLRALRFAARFDLTVDGEAAEALCALAPRIGIISRERVFSELDGFLKAPGFVRTALRFSELLFEAVKELRPMAGCPQRCPYHVYDVWEHSLWAVDNVPPVSLLRWSALLHDVGKPAAHTTDRNGQDHFRGHESIGADMAGSIMEGLRMPRKMIDTAVRLIRLHDRRFRVEDVRSVMRRLGPEDTRSLILLQRGDMLAHSPLIAERAPQTEDLLKEVARIEKSGEAYTVRQLKINGNDLVRLGFRGPRVGAVLEGLLTRVMAGEAANEREALLRAARESL